MADKEDWRDCPKCKGTTILSVNPGYPEARKYRCPECDSGKIPPLGHWFSDGCNAEHTKVTIPCKAEVFEERDGFIGEFSCGLSQQRFEHQCALYVKKDAECDDGHHHRFVR